MSQKQKSIVFFVLGTIFLALAIAANALSKITGQRMLSFVSAGFGVLAAIFFVLRLKTSDGGR